MCTPINFDDKLQPIWSSLGWYAYTFIYIPPSILIKILRKFPLCTSIRTCTIILNVIKPFTLLHVFSEVPGLSAQADEHQPQEGTLPLPCSKQDLLEDC